MDRRSVLTASAAALALFAIWWVAIRRLDSSLALVLPYHQYAMAALLYPEVYYPALPGWVLAQIQPYSWGVWIVTFGWMIVLSVAIGAGASTYGSERDRSPAVVAATAVAGLFVIFTGIEAAGSLVG